MLLPPVMSQIMFTGGTLVPSRVLSQAQVIVIGKRDTLFCVFIINSPNGMFHFRYAQTRLWLHCSVGPAAIDTLLAI